MRKTLALLAALCLPLPALAGPYLLLGGASGKVDLDDLEAAYLPGSPQTDDSFGRALIGVGADVTPYLALEAVYLTKAEASVRNVPTAEQETLESAGPQFAVLAKAPLTPGFSLFGKLSGNYMDVKYRYETPLTRAESKDSKFHLGFGAGLEFLFNDDVGLRLTAERIQFRDAINGNGDTDLDQATLAVVLNF